MHVLKRKYFEDKLVRAFLQLFSHPGTTDKKPTMFARQKLLKWVGQDQRPLPKYLK